MKHEGFVPGASHDTFIDRKSTRLNSSHTVISYAVFCLRTAIHTTEVLPDRAVVCRFPRRLVAQPRWRPSDATPPPAARTTSIDASPAREETSPSASYSD